MAQVTKKASSRRDSVELNSRTILRLCELLRSEGNYSWLHCADVLGISANSLRTHRKIVTTSELSKYVDVSAESVIRTCNIFRGKENAFSWLHCANAFNITVNTLTTLRKNAAK